MRLEYFGASIFVVALMVYIFSLSILCVQHILSEHSSERDVYSEWLISTRHQTKRIWYNVKTIYFHSLCGSCGIETLCWSLSLLWSNCNYVVEHETKQYSKKPLYHFRKFEINFSWSKRFKLSNNIFQLTIWSIYLICNYFARYFLFNNCWYTLIIFTGR